MVRLLIVLSCLAFILSLGTGSIAHAMAPIDCSAASQVLAADDDTGAGRSTPTDPGKVCHRSHCGCHGHHLAALPAVSALAIARVGPPDLFIHTANALAAAPRSAELRPPKA